MTSLNVVKKIKEKLSNMVSQEDSLQVTLDDSEPLTEDEEVLVRLGLLIALQVVDEFDVPIQ